MIFVAYSEHSMTITRYLVLAGLTVHSALREIFIKIALVASGFCLTFIHAC